MINSRFENISLTENGIIISFISAEQKEISFSEIDKIYISVNRVSPIYVFLFIITSVFVMGFSFWFMDFDMLLILPVLIIFFLAVKFYDYKRYGMTISLKNGKFLEQQVPLKLRYEAIDLVNVIRKKLFYATIKV